ncbi:receptor-type tyrosine-protein phosphatase T-like isoform X3 [Dreissena polymorpha]|uniref:receptor-type tyrosine-protein phosphatase T-like isoform X3 n=1 Tax=Dreissena polymorpha TaxID=45954 RepID=UPI0022645640|nr:receptor-type tyrosine-protein phosphatase T-like isoform X3 [Dreissena polymorpha]
MTVAMGLMPEFLQDEQFTIKNVTVAEKWLNPPREIQFVRVMGSKSGSEPHMVICEIVIFRQTDCPLGSYSVNCSKQCHCRMGSCDSVTGACSNGICADGWKGMACNENCPLGSYSVNCSKQCHCRVGSCDSVTGACSNGICADGWKGMACNENCPLGSYSVNCSKQCHCRVGSCDSVTGACSNGICADGWKGMACNENCPLGSYSVNCSKQCHCRVGCDSVTGACWNGICADGWKGMACNETCHPGTFGANCSSICRCHNNITCYNINGSCPNNQCAAGWKHDNCSVACGPGNFGLNCTSPCHCLNGESCDHVSGNCPGDLCAPGWTTSNCSVACHPGTFGANCSSICHCHNNMTCNHFNGSCPNNQCAAGWKHDNCSVACGQGNFGLNCTSPCHCLQGASCDHVSGNCPGDQCASGWTTSNCSVACESGSYGQNCSMDCHCDKCHHVNGSCAMSSQCHNGYRMDNGFCKPQEETRGINTIMIAGVVGGCVAAILIAIGIAGVILCYRRRKLQSRSKSHTGLSIPSKIETNFKGIDRAKHFEHVSVEDTTHISLKDVSKRLPGVGNSTDAQFDDPNYYSFKTVTPGIKIHDLWDYIHEKRDSIFFDAEFKKLRSGLIHKHEIASSEENKGKNRYKKLYAYDHNRVSLTKELEGESEYINASFIHGFQKIKKFIASQGATEKTLEDLWRMIWQQKVDKIVMLTNLVEMGTLKCLQYWPEELNGVCKYGRVDVKYVDVVEMGDYNIRTFQITKGHDTRVVKQFHFKAWPDKDVPDTAWCLVDFWRAVDTRDEQQSPILVHCSAGVGRTGTFIALDNLISQAKMEKCVRPFQMVEALREQRVSMVQTKEQYVYLHEALAEAFLIGTQHVTTGQFERVYNYMMGRNDDSTATRLEHQFELVRQSVEHHPVEIQEVSSQEAEYGNIETVGTEIHAYRHPQNRKREQPIELNIPTFSAKNGICVVSRPTEPQLSMFWYHLQQRGIVTLIDIASNGSETKYVLKDGTDGEHIENGALSVIKESLHNGFVEITYSVKKNANESGFDKTIKHFVLTSWKGDDTHTERTSLLKMIEAVHTWQPEMKEDKPILILDNACFQKCGVVAVLINEIYRISAQHGHINILESVKTMVQGKSLLIHSKMQLKFCYDVILDYVEQQATYQNY